jgi:hypothetical protein
MAISPKQLNKAFLEEADKYEALIDNELRKKVLPVGGICQVEVPKGMTYLHFDLLKPKYIQAGWKDIKWNSFYDQRDGDIYTSIEFYSESNSLFNIR